MKILFGAQPAIAIKKGGLYVQLMSTRAHLEDLGFQVELYSPWKCPRKDEFLLFHLFGANFSTSIIGEQVKNIDIPLVLTPVYFSQHGLFALKFTNKMNSILFKLFKLSTPHIYTKNLFDIADIILPNTWMEKQLITNGFGVSEKKVRVIHNGIDKRFLNASKELFVGKYGVEDFILYVGYIGDERKNTLNFVKAVKGIDKPVVLIGPVVKSAYGARCMEEIKKDKNIILLEPFPHNSRMLESAYASCDVFILPSLFETPGLAALEAGLAGAKIVITKYGGTNEYYRDEAVYIEPRSVTSIRNGLEKAIGKRKNDLLVNRIKKNFLLDVIVKKTAKIYQEFV
ncbi:MAG: hypothetical protein B5M53_04480 [Candidatus Cloacimonas sp. 4484_209]|nr:MAG: hypothetical protein B5M53_04480 [Candidatus Cloacimonas sp. 4484_209]